MREIHKPSFEKKSVRWHFNTFYNVSGKNWDLNLHKLPRGGKNDASEIPQTTTWHVGETRTVNDGIFTISTSHKVETSRVERSLKHFCWSQVQLLLKEISAAQVKSNVRGVEYIYIYMSKTRRAPSKRPAQLTSIHTNLHTSIHTKQSRSNTYKHTYKHIHKTKQKQYSQAYLQTYIEAYIQIKADTYLQAILTKTKQTHTQQRPPSSTPQNKTAKKYYFI